MEFIKAILKSKKAGAAIASVIMAIIGKKIGLDEAAVQSIVYTLIAYIVGQGVADLGKEKVKAEA